MPVDARGRSAAGPDAGDTRGGTTQNGSGFRIRKFFGDAACRREGETPRAALSRAIRNRSD
jgi:hypothetical protein